METAVLVVCYSESLTNAKMWHGLIRGPCRYELLGFLDLEGRLASGSVVEVGEGCLEVIGSLEDLGKAPDHCILIGGKPPLSTTFVDFAVAALHAGLGVINISHYILEEVPEVRAALEAGSGQLRDLRKSKHQLNLGPWTGEVLEVPAMVIPVIGMDCCCGKRTTAQLLLQGLRGAGVAAELVYTGQTGWLQGSDHGFIEDTTKNDFFAGEFERSIVGCFADTRSEVILIEGQSGLRNPACPMSVAMLTSTNAAGVVLQAIPGREHYILSNGRARLPSIESEVALIEGFGVPVLAVALNGDGLEARELRSLQARLRSELERPVVCPLEDGVAELVSLLRDL